MPGGDLEFSSGRVEAHRAGLVAGHLASASPEAANLTWGWPGAVLANSWNGVSTWRHGLVSRPVRATPRPSTIRPFPKGMDFESITRQWASSSRPSIDLRAYRYVLALVCGRTAHPGVEVHFPRLRSARMPVSKHDSRLYRSRISR